MSFNPVNQTFDDLQDAINDCQSDVTKFIEGNNSAGTRVRKAMQEVKRLAQDTEKFVEGNNSAGTRVRKCMQSIKNLAQEVRKEVQEQKNSQF